MDRDAQHDAARRNAWETATSVAERIHKLTQVAADYPEYMTTFADIAASYLAMDDRDNARHTYQHIVDHQRQFAHLWANELGKAYLFTTNYEQAIATRIGKLNGIFVPVSVGAHRRSPPAWTLHRLDVPLPAPAGQRAGEVWGASPGCSGGEGLGTGGGGRQGRNDGTRKCPGSARTSPPKPRHGSWTSRTQRVLGEHGPGQSEGERTPAGDAARYA